MQALFSLFCCQYITIDLSNEDSGDKDCFNLGEGRHQGAENISNNIAFCDSLTPGHALKADRFGEIGLSW